MRWLEPLDHIHCVENSRIPKQMINTNKEEEGRFKLKKGTIKKKEIKIMIIMTKTFYLTPFNFLSPLYINIFVISTNINFYIL